MSKLSQKKKYFVRTIESSTRDTLLMRPLTNEYHQGYEQQANVWNMQIKLRMQTNDWMKKLATFPQKSIQIWCLLTANDKCFIYIKKR